MPDDMAEPCGANAAQPPERDPLGGIHQARSDPASWRLCTGYSAQVDADADWAGMAAGFRASAAHFETGAKDRMGFLEIQQHALENDLKNARRNAEKALTSPNPERAWREVEKARREADQRWKDINALWRSIQLIRLRAEDHRAAAEFCDAVADLVGAKADRCREGETA